MLVSTLNGQHPTYNAPLWAKYDALYRGGEAFRASVELFLPRNPEEPGEVYRCRCAEAFYRSFVGPIVDFFAAKLFSAPLSARPKGEGEDEPLDDFWAAWKEDVTGGGVDLIDFARGRLTSAFVKGRSWWLVELPSLDEGDDRPPPVNRAQYVEMGLDKPYLCPLENEQVLDFETDRRGELVWAIVHELHYERPDPTAPRTSLREMWRVYDRENVSTFEVVYDPARGDAIPETATSLGTKAHGFSRVPLVRCGFVGTKGVRAKIGNKRVNVAGEQLEGLWLVNRIAEPQVEHFRLSNALSWNVKRTCYAMPVFKVTDAANPPTMGAGYYIMIGTEEDFSWAAPPVAHLDLVAKEVAAQKDEIYRLANQMANGVENNAAAVGRSGESKAVDNANAEVCLGVYGAIVKEAIEQTYQLVADARGEDIEWSVEGLDTFDLGDASDVLETATKAALLNIPSKTFKKELFGGVVNVVAPHISQATKDTIKKEISDGVEEAAKAVPPPTPLQPAASPPVGEATAPVPPATSGAQPFGGSATPTSTPPAPSTPPNQKAA